MRGFTMVLFLGAAIALPIPKSGFSAGEIVTSSSWSPQVLESVLPRSPFSCCHKAAGHPSRIKGGEPTYGPIVDNGQDNNTTPPDANLEREPAGVKDTEKGTANIFHTSHVQARDGQNASFWRRASVDDSRTDAKKGTITTSNPPPVQTQSTQNGTFWGRAYVASPKTPSIQARNPQNPKFWGPAHVDDTPADAEEGTASTSDTPPIEARSPQSPTFWGPAHVDDTPADAEKGTTTSSDIPQMQERSPQGPNFWGPAHVDDTPADAEDSAGSPDGDATVGNGQKSA